MKDVPFLPGLNYFPPFQRVLTMQTKQSASSGCFHIFLIIFPLKFSQDGEEMHPPPTSHQSFFCSEVLRFLKPPSYSPWDFWLLLKLKEPLYGMNFNTQEELIARVREQLKLMPKSVFLECFHKWTQKMCCNRWQLFLKELKNRRTII